MLKDQDIREPLFDYLEIYYGKVRIIEEKNMGKSRADVVMVLSDCLMGIEIKSDADTYARLGRQIKDYDKYFDYNIIVVGSHHGRHVNEHVPDYWGIITVELIDGKFDFYKVRDAKPNPKIVLQKKMEILWRNELAQILELFVMPKYTSKNKAFVADKIIKKCQQDNHMKELSIQISNVLFERDYNMVRNNTVSSVVDEKKRKHYCYMVRCADNSLYTGYAVNPVRRLNQHNNGTGAKYTKIRRPCTLVYVEEFDDKPEALKREYEIKHKMTKKQKEKLLSDERNKVYEF